VINLREDILSLRIKYSLTSMDEKKRRNYLGRAARALEKYFFIIAYASFVEERKNETFSSWMQTRVEIWKYVTFTGGGCALADTNFIAKYGICDETRADWRYLHPLKIYR